MSTESTIVKKDNAGALSTINLRADSGKGTEELRSDDVSTPILKILHQLSPECNSRNAKYVEGAKPGMIYSGSFGNLIGHPPSANPASMHTRPKSLSVDCEDMLIHEGRLLKMHVLD